MGSGKGSAGTVVFAGTLGTQPVAIKQYLKHYHNIVEREIAHIKSAAPHPNVVRYLHQEAAGYFIFVVLELALCSLADLIEGSNKRMDIREIFQPRPALREMTEGLHHLHSLEIVHRDLKPANVLVSQVEGGFLRMLITDFGLSTSLGPETSMFYPTRTGAGTPGWRAPEVMTGGSRVDSGIGGLKKSLDIFPLGCLYFYVVTDGLHPFGERGLRDVNILSHDPCLAPMDHQGDIPVDLVRRMLGKNPVERYANLFPSQQLKEFTLRYAPVSDRTRPQFWLNQSGAPPIAIYTKQMSATMLHVTPTHLSTNPLS